MQFAFSVFPLLLQTTDTFCAVCEMKYNYFFKIMLTVSNDKKKLALLSSIAHSFSPVSDMEINH